MYHNCLREGGVSTFVVRTLFFFTSPLIKVRNNAMVGVMGLTHEVSMEVRICEGVRDEVGFRYANASNNIAGSKARGATG